MMFYASRERDAQVHAAGVGPRWIEDEGVRPVLQRRAHREGPRALLRGAHGGARKDQNEAAATDKVRGTTEAHHLTGRAGEGQRGILGWDRDRDRRGGTVDGQRAAHVRRYVVEREGRARGARSARSQKHGVGDLRAGQRVSAEEPRASPKEG